MEGMEQIPYEAPRKGGTDQRQAMGTAAAPRRSLVLGVVSGAAFWIFFVYLMLYVMPDPQGAIALALSPFYSAFVGLMVGVIHNSARSFTKGNGGNGALVLLLFASFGLAAISIWLLLEVLQYYRVI
jgi:hypothetical protein